MLNLLTPDDDETQGNKDADLNALRRQSAQELPSVDKKSGNVESSFWSFDTQRGSILPAWGTRERERWLRLYDRNEYNTLWQGASSGLIKKIKATPYELKGGRNLTNKFADILGMSQFTTGWGTFLSLMLRDYLRFDGGAYAEIIAPGNPLKAPTGAVTGIAHLDSYYCVPTGDPEYPVVYTDRAGKPHILHHTRILHLLDMPDGDQNHPGYGLCAQSRAIAVIQRQLLVSQYIVSKLDDKPSPGVVIANNINSAERNNIFAAFRREQGTDIPPEWGRVAWVFNLDPKILATLENFTFAQAPDKFDYPVYVNLDINELALAIGIDKQELWELSGATGTAGQSIVQAEKSEGKAPGEIRAMLEREINYKLLPDSLEFQWKVKDGRAAQQEAATAQIWVSVGTAIAPIVGNEIAAQLMANNVTGISDVLFDENGQMIRLPDADPQDPNQQQQDVTVEDTAPNDTGSGSQSTAQDSTPNANSAKPAKKDFDATRRSFESNLADLLSSGTDRRRAGVVMRAQLNSAGKSARADGLADGGVTSGLSDADLNAHTVWLAKQSAWVTDFLDSAKSGLSDAAIQQHAAMWANVSLQTAYYEGVASADANGMYAFGGTDGEESCVTCKSLQGTKMRMSEWTARKLRPGVDTESYDCGGYQCKHRLSKVTA